MNIPLLFGGLVLFELVVFFGAFRLADWRERASAKYSAHREPEENVTPLSHEENLALIRKKLQDLLESAPDQGVRKLVEELLEKFDREAMAASNSD